MTVERPFLLTFVIRITVFVKKCEKLIPIILYIYASFRYQSTQSMCLKKEISLPLSITHNIMQGSALGPMLYVLYM